MHSNSCSKRFQCRKGPTLESENHRRKSAMKTHRRLYLLWQCNDQNSGNCRDDLLVRTDDTYMVDYFGIIEASWISLLVDLSCVIRDCDDDHFCK